MNNVGIFLFNDIEILDAETSASSLHPARIHTSVNSAEFAQGLGVIDAIFHPFIR